MRGRNTDDPRGADVDHGNVGHAAEAMLRDAVGLIERAIVQTPPSSALMVSQKNSEAVLGIPHRQHLENCRRPDFTPKVVAHGKLRLVDVAEYRAWLHELGRRDHQHENVDPDDRDAALLRELDLCEVKAPEKKSNRSHATRDLTRTRVG